MKRACILPCFLAALAAAALPGCRKAGASEVSAAELSVFGDAEADNSAYTQDTLISDVMNDPVFGDYGRLIFPVDSGYMSGNTLGELRLVWYHNIQPEKTVEIANYFHDQAASGQQIFYDIYTEEEKAADPEKKNTGLFFFRGKQGEKTAVVNAGGGFAYVGAMQDSFPVALELSKMGYHSFALIYRPDAEAACEDLSRALVWLTDHAESLGISMDDYSLWGGSAGARMADWVGTEGTAAFGERALPQPAMVVTQYTGLTEVTGYEPPTYANVGTSDGIASASVMQDRIRRIRANGTDAEIDVFEGLQHGFGLGEGTVADGWVQHAVSFWEKEAEK